MATIVMTGGTSGFGGVTASRLAATPGTRLILGARKAPADAVDVLPLDLSRLAEVRSFAASVERRLGAAPIDVLILNAGLSLDSNALRTEDGYETTFAVNHLGHYLLLRSLLPRLADGARVILTTSGTHDPAEGTIIPPPKHADAARLARPEHDPEADGDAKVGGGRAYAASKLCNVLTAQSLRVEPEATAKRLAPIAFDPGPTPGTGLSRNRSLGIRMLWSLLGSPLGRLVPKFSSREAAGNALADLALGQIPQPSGEVYAKLRKGTVVWAHPSVLARDAEVAAALWRDSASLVGDGVQVPHHHRAVQLHVADARA